MKDLIPYTMQLLNQVPNIEGIFNYQEDFVELSDETKAIVSFHTQYDEIYRDSEIRPTNRVLITLDIWTTSVSVMEETLDNITNVFRNSNFKISPIDRPKDNEYYRKGIIATALFYNGNISNE